MELAEHIAACDFVFKNQDSAGSCTAIGKDPYVGDEVDTIVIFTDSQTGCNSIETEGYCVYVSGNSSATFTS